jgi:NitT/TauT family transport system substrate-binding protein
MRTFAMVLCAAIITVWVPRAAPAADNTLHVLAAFPGGIEVLENVARYGGLYQAENLDVDKQYAGGAALCAQLAATGKADICATSIEPSIIGYDKGIRLQLIFSRVREYEYVLAVTADSPIHSLADFKGKQIGEPSLGETTEIPVDDMLAGAGLKKSDYTYVPVGVGAAQLAALVNHKVDAVATSATGFTTDAAIAHVNYRFFRDPILDDVPNSGFEARPDAIANKADLLRKFVRAITKAAILIRENPQVAARYALMGEKVIGGTATPDALAKEADVLKVIGPNLADPTNPRIGYTPINGVQIYCQFLYNAGRTSTLVPAGAVVNNQFIPYANDFDKKAWIAEVKAMR